MVRMTTFFLITQEKTRMARICFWEILLLLWQQDASTVTISPKHRSNTIFVICVKKRSVTITIELKTYLFIKSNGVLIYQSFNISCTFPKMGMYNYLDRSSDIVHRENIHMAKSIRSCIFFLNCIPTLLKKLQLLLTWDELILGQQEVTVMF